ncbi:hypothetical protein PoB_001748200 [Plakobranchus ocellatus]|uniref:Uncharacterized protein n=1 Tax=Plakobranchus ocellatus TaxID=259542 RepID=A0AAV3Z6W7_9GAST|nr:hypothetical protein PoB_001748200 [Plakobranchus ocellatus]
MLKSTGDKIGVLTLNQQESQTTELQIQHRGMDYEQVSGLKHMDQSVIHHPLKDLTQAARERNRPIVGRIRRILPGFWNWNHRRLPPRWGDVPGGPDVI